MNASGLIIRGRTVLVPGLTIYNCNDADWCRLHPGDYRARSGSPNLIIDHTTGGHSPQPVLRGAGPRGHAEQIAKMWSGRDRGGGEKIHSGAPILVDFDGSIWCLGDLWYCASYAAELANDASISIEHCTTPRGEIYQATIDATVPLHRAICREVGIPWQVHGGPYRNAPLARCETGRKTKDRDGRVQSKCKDVYGVIQHRDQTSERGWGDAGDPIRDAQIAAGAESLDYAASEDLSRGRARQRYLNGLGERLTVDGLVGATSLGAADRQGFERWRDVPME